MSASQADGREDLPDKAEEFNLDEAIDRQRINEMDYEMSLAASADLKECADKVFDVIKNYSKVDLAAYIAVLLQMHIGEVDTDALAEAMFKQMHHGDLHAIMPRMMEAVRDYSSQEIIVYLTQLVGATVNPSYYNLMQRKRVAYAKMKQKGGQNR